MPSVRVFLSSQGLCSYEGAQFPPTVSLSENYSVCADLMKEMPTVSHLVTSSVLNSCKSYTDPYHAKKQASTFDKTIVSKAGSNMKRP